MSSVAQLGAQGATAPALPPLNFSGIIFGSYSFQQSTTPNQLNRQIDNSLKVVADELPNEARRPSSAADPLDPATDPVAGHFGTKFL